MNRHGLDLAQMLAVSYIFVGFIDDIGFKVFPFCACVEEFPLAGKHLLLRHCHTDLAMIIKTVKNGHLIDIPHVCCLYEGDKLPPDSGV